MRAVADLRHKKLNVPNLRFPEFQGEWEKCKVSDLLDFYSTNSLSWDKLEYGTTNIQNLHYGLIHVGLPTMVDIDKDNLPNIIDGNVPKNYELCKEGDIVFADASEDTNEVAKAVEYYNLNGKKVVCGLHTIHGRDNKNKTVVGYKGYAFSSMSFHHQIRRIAQGTKIYSINSKNFSECYVGIPSKDEQQKIADLLRLIDERIATQNKIIEDLKKLKVAIIEKMFCSPNQEQPMCRIKGFKQPLTTYKLGSFCSRIVTKNKDAKCSLVLTIAAQYGLVNQESFFNKSVASENLTGYYLLQKGEFAYNRSYSMGYDWGAVKRLDNYDKGVLSTLYICFKINETIVDSDYLAYYFESSKWHRGLSNIAGEGARNHGLLNVSVTDYFNTQHRFPPIEEQKTIAKMLNSITEKASEAVKLGECYQKQKQYLLRKMFI